MKCVGVLALQGAVEPHLVAITRLGLSAVAVHRPEQLAQVEGLILPGGESTVQNKLIEGLGFDRALARFSKGPVLGTCAGLILASQKGWLDVSVERNGWGPQPYSRSDVTEQGRAMVLIRAPRIKEVGPEVEVLDTFKGEPVWVRQGRVFGATFHPELTDQLSVHRAVFGDL